VPIGIFGTVWAYLMLHETASIRRNQKMDWPGTLTFAAGLTVLLLGITYGIEPYGTSSTGWGNPLVIAALVGGVLRLALFVLIELQASDPMFRLSLFRIRTFAAGNIANFLGALTRGGLQFMLVIWLQGIWLPLHGYSFATTPLWAGIYMTPLLIGFIVKGPVSGWLSDHYGVRRFAVLGLLVNAVGFIGLVSLPADFNYPIFAFWLVVLGVGQGLFAAPNTTAVMNSVPREHRGVSSGMRATFMNAASLMSIGIFFSIVTEGLAAALPSSLFHGLTHAGLPAPAATAVSELPPTAALFAAFLGYNPLATLLPHAVLAQLPVANQLSLLSKQFFPSLIAQPFIGGMRGVFIFSTVLCVIGAVVSIFCKGQPVDGKLETLPPVTAEEELATPEILPALELSVSNVQETAGERD
jgi:MFS family permease